MSTVWNHVKNNVVFSSKFVRKAHPPTHFCSFKPWAACGAVFPLGRARIPLTIMLLLQRWGQTINELKNSTNTGGGA